MNFIRKTGLFATLGLLTTINVIGVLPTMLASKAVASTPKTFRFNPIYAGDCQMYNATLTFNRDGTGQFTSRVRTLHTSNTDYWHVRFVVKNQSGVELLQLGEWKGPGMKNGNPPPMYDFNQGFAYNQVNLPAINRISVISSC